MSEETKAPPRPQPSPDRPQINITPSGQEALEIYKAELATYVRELPRLLEEGYAGMHALVKGDEVVSIWDTQGDAIQAARERVGPDAAIFVKKIDPRDVQRFAWLKAQLGEACPF